MSAFLALWKFSDGSKGIMNKLIGITIDHYQILVKIRETPTRILFKAYNTRAQNQVALEVVKVAGPRPDELLGLINEQMRKNAVLTHPNIATIIDAGLHEGLIYIVYSFSPTRPLHRFFNRTYSWQETSRELVSVTNAMAYAHEKGVMHGYLQPASVVLDERRNPILFDFGFEQIITSYLLAYAPGAWLNRWGFEYRPPEQLNGALPDARSDIYSMGMMLYEWLNGKLPLLDSTILGTLQMRMNGVVVADKKSSVPPVIQNLIRKCLSSNPDDRYQLMQEIYIVLARGALDMSITRKMIRKPLEIPRQTLINARPLIRQLRFPALFFSIAVAGLLLLMNVTGWSLKTMIAPPATTTPTATNIQPTSTRTLRPPSTPTAPVVVTETPQPAPLVFPVYQETPIVSAIDQTISADNINSMVMLSILGMGNVSRMASSPDGKYVVAGSSIGIFVFDAQDLTLTQHIDTRSWITALDFSPDSTILATGDRDGLIQLWDTAAWQEARAPYSGHKKAIVDLAFSPDRTKLASVSLDNDLIQWDLNSTENSRSSLTLLSQVSAVAYSGDSTRIVTGGNDLLINIWDAANLSFVKKKDFSAQIVDIVNVQDSSVFVIGGNDQSVGLLDISGEVRLTSVGRLRYPLTSVAASRDGRLISAGDLNGGVAVWERVDEKSNEVVRPKSLIVGDMASLEEPGSPHSIAFSQDGQWIFSGLQNGTIRSLNASTGADEKQALLFNAHAEKLAISHDSQIMITQQENGTLTIWDLWSGAPRYQLPGQIKGNAPFSPDDQLFAVASVDPGPSLVTVHDSGDGEIRYTFRSQRNLNTIEFINDGDHLITIYDDFANLWAISNGQQLETKPIYEGTGCLAIKDIYEQPVASITNHYHVVTNDLNKPRICTFDPQNWITAFNESRGLIVYGGSSKLSIANLRGRNGEDRNLRGVNRKNIVAVAISPNGDLIAAAYDDHTIHIWNAESRDELGNWYGHSDAITGLQFTPDGKLLISTSVDGSIRLWGIPY